MYETRNNLTGAADAHLALADMAVVGTVADPEEQRTHLEAADALYRRLGSNEGRVKAEQSLGIYYATHNNNMEKARHYLDTALTVAREARGQDLEAGVLSQIGKSYDLSSDFIRAAEYYHRSARRRESTITASS